MPDPPPSPPKPSTPAPPLIRKETSPASFTLYLDVSLGKTGGGGVMGVFVPQNYKPQATVDVILYLHGHKVRIVKSNYSIDDIWGLSAFPMRQDLNTSGKQFILVAPTLGPKSESGDLAGMADGILDSVMAALHTYGPHQSFQKAPTVGRIILSSHSGGGKPMLAVANSLTKYKDNVSEIWGIDTMYGPVEDDWQGYAKGHSGVKIVFYYNDTASRSLTVAGKTKRLQNVYVLEGGAGHDYLVQKHWLERLNCIGADCPDDAKRREKTAKKVKRLGK